MTTPPLVRVPALEVKTGCSSVWEIFLHTNSFMKDMKTLLDTLEWRHLKSRHTHWGSRRQLSYLLVHKLKSILICSGPTRWWVSITDVTDWSKMCTTPHHQWYHVVVCRVFKHTYTVMIGWMCKTLTYQQEWYSTPAHKGLYQIVLVICDPRSAHDDCTAIICTLCVLSTWTHSFMPHTSLTVHRTLHSDYCFS